MKKLIILVVVLVSLIAFVACNNLPESSKEEALYVVKNEPGFQHLIQYYSIKSFGIFYNQVYFNETYPKLDFNDNVEIGHIAIYQTNNNTFYLLVLSSGRPTNVIIRREIAYQYQAQESQK